MTIANTGYRNLLHGNELLCNIGSNLQCKSWFYNYLCDYSNFWFLNPLLAVFYFIVRKFSGHRLYSELSGWKKCTHAKDFNSIPLHYYNTPNYFSNLNFLGFPCGKNTMTIVRPNSGSLGGLNISISKKKKTHPLLQPCQSWSHYCYFLWEQVWFIGGEKC